ncbi:alpha/beta fold hydrolase [Microbacterium sp. SORGH_AS_0862]|uniref:alpha/beta fold hydrolase n=1 Tax=Microbacterium sp. SORGH_AS_0862 TaxID=3041789 RepID=UPI0035947B91
MPDPRYVMVGEGHRIATYSWGEPDAPTAVVVHGFASSTRDNWVSTGWVRDLQRAGFRVVGLDQRGHGASDKPHEARDYDLRELARDVEAVMDTYLIDDAVYVGYSLGARVGWEVLRDLPERVLRAVLGGVPDGVPLARLDLDQVSALIEDGTRGHGSRHPELHRPHRASAGKRPARPVGDRTGAAVLGDRRPGSCGGADAARPVRHGDPGRDHRGLTGPGRCRPARHVPGDPGPAPLQRSRFTRVPCGGDRVSDRGVTPPSAAERRATRPGGALELADGRNPRNLLPVRPTGKSGEAERPGAPSSGEPPLILKIST